MKRENIYEAAHKHSSEVSNDAYMSGTIGSFIAGANWRIDSVWHDVKERPNENEPAIIEKNNGEIFFAENGYYGPWEYNVKYFGFKRWAYIEDLIPTKDE